MPDWTNVHFFFSSRNCCQVRFWSLNFVIRFSLRDSRGYGKCGNEIKPRTLACPDDYKHCNVPSDSSLYLMNRHSIMTEESEEKKNFIVKKSLRPVPSRGMVEQAKKTWRLQTPARLPRKRRKTQTARWPRIA